ncbi:DUF5627 domain-containing protein [uncultured Draconibacterium sp.]|uniref:DUF5627 domain-containing protein n=1 Tax=uncultured Draconibacterium sp. TaxID=1573823 RepID=UPI0029C945E2|nr:DUF5627 domain-containing protein [uncultured Draconibacterium sp.]
MKMKKYCNILCNFLLIIGIASCSNSEWEFDDFDYTASYFPYQFPLRTLVMDDTYSIDNSNDLQMRFLISAAMGGGYENEKDQNIQFEIDESLTQGLYSESGNPILPLPSNYYSITNSNNTLIIPKGKFDGSIEVQLTDAFFDDSLSTELNYVLPVKLIAADTDSMLMGRPISDNADPRIAEDWEIIPKHYTLFGIKYVNKYHGSYLLRGKSTVKDMAGQQMDNIIYHQNYVVDNEVVRLNTIYKKSVIYSNELRLSEGSPGTFKFVIDFTNEENGTIHETKDSDFAVTGNAQFQVDGDEWGGKRRNAIYLDYEINDGNYIHSIKDTLVFRDKNVQFEEYLPVVQ